MALNAVMPLCGRGVPEEFLQRRQVAKVKQLVSHEDRYSCDNAILFSSVF